MTKFNNPRRVDMKSILADPVKRRYMLIHGIMSVQAIEGRFITEAQAAEALDSVHVAFREKSNVASEKN